MFANVLELVNLIVFFRLVLGCDFRKNRSFLVLGGLLMVGHLLFFNLPILEDAAIEWGEYGVWISFVLIGVCLFAGKIWTTAGLGITLCLFTITIAGLLQNIGILILQGDVLKVNFRLLYYVALLLTLVGSICAGKILGEKKRIVRDYVYHMNPIIWIIVIVYFEIVRTEYVGGLTDYEIEIGRSYNLIKDGILGIALLVLLCLLGALKFQRQTLQRLVRLNEKCIAQQAEQYAFMGEKDQELRKFRHDYNRHLHIIQNYLNRKEYEALETYLAELGAAGEDLRFLSTNNLICDAVTNRYYGLCKENHIGLSVTGKITGNLPISQTDFCVILSNALENAVEATELCPNHRKITMQIRQESGLLFLELRNPTSKPLILNGEGVPETSNADRKNHGIGTRNMKEAVLKNDGDIGWEYDSDGFVITKIVLPFEQKD